MKSKEIAARRAKYSRVERVADSLGRTFGVRMLKPSQQLRVQEMAPALEGTTPSVDEKTGKAFDVPKISPLIIAASVCEVDGDTIPFPKSRADLDFTLDMLDEEGMQAVVEGMARFAPPKPEDADGGSGAETTAAVAKN